MTAQKRTPSMPMRSWPCSRRRIAVAQSIGALCLILSSVVGIGSAVAQTYPVRAVRVVVPFPAGGTADILARILGQRLHERLGQPFVVENKPGGASNIATREVINSKADGYTLLIATPTSAINAALYKRLPFNYIHDTVPVAGIALVPNVMAIHPDVPVKTIEEFIAYARGNPGKINMASSGHGTSIHLAGELFKAMTGIAMVHVPYKGSTPALTDLLGGQVQVMFDNLPTSIAHIRAGHLRALGVTTASRSPQLFDVPAIGEFVPGFEAASWFGLSAPKGTPAKIVEMLNAEINLALADPKIKARLEALGAMIFAVSPSEFGNFIQAETDKWRPLVTISGATLD